MKTLQTTIYWQEIQVCSIYQTNLINLLSVTMSYANAAQVGTKVLQEGSIMSQGFRIWCRPSKSTKMSRHPLPRFNPQWWIQASITQWATWCLIRTISMSMSSRTIFLGHNLLLNYSSSISSKVTKTMMDPISSNNSMKIVKLLLLRIINPCSTPRDLLLRVRRVKESR